MQTANVSHALAQTAVRTRELIDEIASAVAEAERRKAQIPPRAVVFSEDQRAAFLSMPALSIERGLFVIKTATYFARAPSDELPTIHAHVVAFSASDGRPLATIDAKAVTDAKCGALAGLAASWCTPAHVRSLSVFGSGAVAAQQIRGICAVRPIERIELHSRTEAHARRLAEVIGELTDRDPIVTVRAAGDPAMLSTDIIATATSSLTPIAAFDELSPEVHISCMGGHTPVSREVPLSVLQSSTLLVEDRPTAIREAGVVHHAALELEDAVSKRTELARERTIFSSTGHAFYDLIVVDHILRNLSETHPELRLGD